MPENTNLRYELRAYTTTDASRLASFLLARTTEPPQPIPRDAIVDDWKDKYPRHAEATGKQSVRSRVTKALALLKNADIACGHEGGTIQVTNVQLLGMAAANLAILEDANGVALPPSEWVIRPNAPAHLEAIQATLEQHTPATATE